MTIISEKGFYYLYLLIIGMEWNALIRIFDGKSALYGMVTDKKVKYKNEKQNGEDSA